MSNVPAFAILAELMILLTEKGLVTEAEVDAVFDKAGHRVANVPPALDAVAFARNILNGYRAKPIA